LGTTLIIAYFKPLYEMRLIEKTHVDMVFQCQVKLKTTSVFPLAFFVHETNTFSIPKACIELDPAGGALEPGILVTCFA
jgi:hypothetical protein